MVSTLDSSRARMSAGAPDMGTPAGTARCDPWLWDAAPEDWAPGAVALACSVMVWTSLARSGPPPGTRLLGQQKIPRPERATEGCALAWSPEAVSRRAGRARARVGG